MLLARPKTVIRLTTRRSICNTSLKEAIGAFRKQVSITRRNIIRPLTLARSQIRLLTGTFIALTLLAGNIGFAAAQTSTPILVAPVGTIRTVDYPISIHQGTCESPVAQPDYTFTNATSWTAC